MIRKRKKSANCMIHDPIQIDGGIWIDVASERIVWVKRSKVSSLIFIFLK